MSNALVVCEVDESLKAKLKKFRFRKETTNAAIIMKIDMEKQLVIVEEEYEDISMDELREELPERQPRFIVYSYKYVHSDGRVSYPLCFIFSSPMGCKPEQQMMYAGSKTGLVHAADLTKAHGSPAELYEHPKNHSDRDSAHCVGGGLSSSLGSPLAQAHPVGQKKGCERTTPNSFSPNPHKS
uniref:ADF-H domain-containing protein n=1 Tax=Gasterosteus aculeatus aculeatus TaxID=481459 RepID=A0AAQ4PXY9_GASAC